MAERLAPAVAARRLAAFLRSRPSATVVVDGPSGAGKSSLADAIVAAAGSLPVDLLRLDAIYPGWDGLAAGSRAVRDGVLIPRARGAAGSWRRWDWQRDRPAESHLVRPGGRLVVEGCGAFARPICLPDPSNTCVPGPENAGNRRVSAPRVVRVWMVAGEDARRRRALERDRGGFDPFWDTWERQWRAYVSAAAPEHHADLVVDGAWPFPR
ncbi:nucleoside/nucleotide kinase family protein [Agromyces mangrovi Wang et al. 2018]|uniref:ATP-binding protein n=1 Tax=Agromyces mangrovi TaxID=1858653 RepID=UPI002572BCBD|nr:ATP-binding protein [Agromyces mangrovi]BDZ63171.1 adenylate kinase [Agromyces mangrovi]